GRLVPEREREEPRQRPLRPFHQMQVGVAEARALDLDEDAARGGLRRLDLEDLRLCLPADESNCLHVVSPMPLLNLSHFGKNTPPDSSAARARRSSAEPAPRGRYPSAVAASSRAANLRTDSSRRVGMCSVGTPSAGAV